MVKGNFDILLISKVGGVEFYDNGVSYYETINLLDAISKGLVENKEKINGGIDFNNEDNKGIIIWSDIDNKIFYPSITTNNIPFRVIVKGIEKVKSFIAQGLIKEAQIMVGDDQKKQEEYLNFKRINAELGIKTNQTPDLGNTIVYYL